MAPPPPATGRGRAFAALRVPNYRRWFAGQAVSLTGTWMQSVAQGWLVLDLTRSPRAVGVVVALQTLPLLLLAPYGGVVADRVDRRRLLVALQAAMGLLALVLGLLAVTGAVRLWHVQALALLLGLAMAFESPTRQAFVRELVGPERVRGAVALNSMQVAVARSVGPAVAGIAIATVGAGTCFLLNAASFAAVVAALAGMDRDALERTEPVARARGQLRAGLAHVRARPALRAPLLMMALVGTIAYEFQVVLPALARMTFDRGPEGYGLLTTAMGLGSLAGGLLVAVRGRTGVGAVGAGAAAFGVAMALAAAAPGFDASLAALALVGAASVAFVSTGNSTLQLAADPAYRGRVMALWMMAFVGSTAIGGPLVGDVAERYGARTALAVGAASCAAATLVAVVERGRAPAR